MRKIIGVLAACAFIFTLAACSAPAQNAETMTVKPTEFSDETKKVLDIVGKDTVFFDFSVDDTIKSYEINTWVFENGEWANKGEIPGTIEKPDNQIAIQLTENGYNIFSIIEDGHASYGAPEMDIGLDSTAHQATDRLETSKSIVIGEEIPLIVKIGNSESKISIPSDFRTSNCTNGIAFTITFSNE